MSISEPVRLLLPSPDPGVMGSVCPQNGLHLNSGLLLNVDFGQDRAPPGVGGELVLLFTRYVDLYVATRIKEVMPVHDAPERHLSARRLYSLEVLGHLPV
ncbi:hypothetical protein DESA109040_16980 [Deinococcus saxicola]|uniref:hypothetical protein n=1 Tax=Deinococcus saxicola TaxID=249406 RepID=UPI0039EE17D5